MNDLAKQLLTWAIIAIVLVSIFNHYASIGTTQEPLSYSQFLSNVRSGDVVEVNIQSTQSGNEITGTAGDGSPFTTFGPPDDELINDLVENDVSISAEPPEKRSILVDLLIGVAPILLLIGVWVYFMRQMQGGGAGGRGAMSFGKSRAKLQGEDQVKVTFEDVAGVEEAKEEVGELVEFLRNPGKFQKLGGHIPRGVLMVGSPGTGKTLLARAIAGEAKVPFFSISGSDFVEMFVGVGASRVRDMFDQAKKHAPCIIFIDEIDAVGRHRGAGLGGGHDEREQTLNQLLVEMDGFEGGEGVIVIAATNRPDVLDPALLRPGRFDRQVVVPLPDIRGREAILKVHMRKVPISDDVDAKVIARGTPGFSGADLANLVNEAALFAARDNAKAVTMLHMDRAKDKIMMGSERRSMVMSEKEKKLTAYHEAGHAIVGRLVPEHDPVYKVTIIPRGRALGVTMFLPEQDKYSISKQQLESQLASLFGGRVAEELIFGAENVTTGASNDIERATAIARNMVTKWGLTEKLGPLTYSEDEDEVFLGRSVTQHKHVSDDTARQIDLEVREIIESAHNNAKQLLEANNEKLHLMAEALMRYETIDTPQIDQIMEGQEPDPPEGWQDADSDNDTDSGAEEKAEDGDRTSVGGPAEQL
ncbi:MAG: ATP-dependent zinc metalloprotease FtsH [Xanthomonadales bacterium]|nr:ATP-dependent zinc metalloprotease FtsH [Gammaproteobacteria bacterium]MBT8056661.1 ATP-dependent zinc metalloprotease FtsH [Gammaproteobacteria bacterium]NNJ79850.1 ATP-dependent zinc metalloprotease FtsH [Xanthomonadales bacterium]NNL03774.1 ATP-dependent zinc metalloprotease FtsH [Xanthomonadales bacterium]